MASTLTCIYIKTISRECYHSCFILTLHFSGTARENVTRDYELRLSRGWDEAEVFIIYRNIFLLFQN